ncbi:FAD-binding protein [Tersicoccus solisilvae]|uniref:FAD-binding protein n=1 Tax=Tersicoccus solisilvae TaxID=1882339 RepID=A0ABQ1NRQ7_9MICC|nr:FAD-dependent oxidoreductase [Tersicoccus solisilvae]GGC83287.1 FAD-binding protein [Tersicoccus solisilvae]
MKYLTEAPAGDVDVLVLGSGAGALTAAATAARAGKTVVVLEKASLLGGTSAISGGMLWIAANHHAREAGIDDSTDAASAYVTAISRGRGRAELVDAAVTFGDAMLRFAEDELGVRFQFLETFPDYRTDLPGSVETGRTIEPQPVNSHALLGGLAAHVRSDGRAPFTMQEYERWGAFTRFPWDELAERERTGMVAKGRALVTMLLAAAVREGVHVAVEARGERLVVDGGRVAGVVLDTGERLLATDAVVIGTGGFEWDTALADSLLASRLFTMCSPPTNEGDGLRMAQRIGAQTRGTREAWWAPMAVTGDTRDGRPIGTLLRFERQGPGSIMVNRDGRRFANESQNYNDLARALQSWDSPNNRTLNTPAHVIIDQQYLDTYGLLAHRAGEPTPAHLVEADTLEELAERIGVPAETLVATVDRFNQHAARGEDPDFHRGETAYDRYWGDAENPWPNPSLAPLARGPFYALEVVNGAFGTSGGIATDGRARVLDVDGAPIAGLFAVGNATESAYAAGYPGAGATLGPLMTMGYLAGRTISGQPVAQDDADALAGAAR